MEFWEGAILVVGGVWLVAHMASKQNRTTQSVIGTSTLGAVGTTNASNLTNLTNQAGGQPTIWGEPLQPIQPPVVGPYTVSAQPVLTPMRQPIYAPITPISKTGVLIQGPTPVARPIVSPLRMQML